MTPQDYAATETSELIHRLLARRSEALSHQLKALNDALHTAGRALEVPIQVEDEVRDLTARLSHTFRLAAEQIQEEGRKALLQLQRELDAERDARETLAVSLSELQADLERERTDSEQQRAELEQQRAELLDANSRLEDAERELARTRDALHEEEAARAAAEATSRCETDARASLEEDLRQARSAHEDADAARQSAEEALARQIEIERALQQELQDVRRTLDGSLSEVAHLGEQLEEVVGEKGRLAIALSAAQGELQMAQAQHKAVATQLKASAARAHMLERSQAETIGQLQLRLDNVHQRSMNSQPLGSSPDGDIPVQQIEIVSAQSDGVGLASVVDASVRTLEGLTRLASLADVLNGLARELSTRFSRVALFRVEGNRLHGEQQVGFDYTTDVRKIAMPLSVDSMLTRVASTGELERLSGSELKDAGKGAPFRGSPSLALGLPIVLRGETVAVAYLDDWDHLLSAPGRGSDESSVLFARLVVGHAGILFIGLTHELKALTELREYATLLVNGAEQMYSADAEAGVPAHTLRSRLEDNLVCARQLFAQRAMLEGPAAAAILDEHLEATIAADPSAAFARDLAAIAVRAHEAEARRSAQAC